MPVSVPTYKMSAVSSTIAFSPEGRPAERSVHVAPKSVVRYRYARKSSWRRRVLVTYAVPAANFDAYTRDTQPSAGPGETSDQCAPASCVTCALPSSVPTQMTPACAGDSEMVVMVQNWIDPRGTLIFSGSLVVRSGEMVCQ